MHMFWPGSSAASLDGWRWADSFASIATLVGIFGSALDQAPWVLRFIATILLSGAGWLWMLRRQVRAKTEIMREFLRREAALKEQYRDLLENAIDIVYTRDLEARITSWNNTAEKVLGYTRAEALGMNIRKLVAPEFLGEVERRARLGIEELTAEDVELEVITKQGTRLTVEVRSRVLYENGKPVGVQGIARNVTARKRVEQQVCLQAAALETAAVGIIITNPEGVILWVNPAFTALSGYSLPEVAGKNPRLLKSGKHDTGYYRNLWETVKSGRVWQGEIINRRKDGTLYDESLAIAPVRGKAGEITHFVAVAQDITLRKRAEEMQQEYEKVVEGSHDMIAVIDRNYSYLLANRAFLNLRQLERKDVVGRPVVEVLGKDFFEGVLREKLNECFRGNAVRFEVRYRYPLIGEREIMASYFPIEGSHGVDRVACVLQDITERKRAEEALQESQARLKAIFDSVQTGIFVIDPEGHRIVEANSVALELVGAPRECVVGATCHSYICPAQEGSCPVTDLGQTVDNSERILLTAGGERRAIIKTVVPVVIAGRRHLLESFVDITARKRAEEALRESEVELAAAQRIAHIGSWYWDLQTEGTRWSEETFRIFGLAPGQLTDHRKTFLDLVHPADRSRVEQVLAAALSGAREYELDYRLRRPDGTERVIHAQAEVLRDPAGKPLAMRGINHDITERQQAEEALRDSEERFRQLAENVEEVFWLFDPLVTKVLYVSPAYERVWGRSCESLYADPRSFLEAIHPEDRPCIMASLDPPRRERSECEYRLLSPDGSVRWVWDRAFPIRGEDGNVVRIAELVQDITERKQVEEATQKAMQAAEEASRAKSEFLANMSHELRTPMNAVIGMTELALATDLDPEQRRYLELVESSANSLLAMINSILDFSKIEARQFDLEAIPFSLRNLMDEALRVLSAEAYRKGLEIAYGVSPAIPSTLCGDPARLKQILVNLVGNAIKFSERGEVVVRVQAESQEDNALWLNFSVADTGVGIPPDKLQVIFEAFTQVDSSMTRRFEGTGLGLAICSELVRMMGGRIWVDSQLGRGSTFHFTVRLGLAPDSRASAPEAPNPRLRGLPVLVVDDHAASREVVAEILLHHGMIPTLAEGPEAALAAIRNTQDSQSPFPLALIDVHMPSRDGFSLAEEAHRIPGFSAAILMMVPPSQAWHGTARHQELGIVNYLHKPVREKELVEAMAQALEKNAALAAATAGSQMRGSSKELGRVLRVLLVENNEVSQVLVTHLLEKRGHEVVVARDGREALTALEHAKAGSFDLALMDIEMPRLGGLETTQALRQRERKSGGHLPIIAMSALPDESEQQRCLAAGMDGYLGKPLRAKELFEIIQKVADAKGQVFDRARFLARLEGDELLISEIVGMFLEEVPKLMGNVCQAIAQGDPHALERAAHTLRGSLADMAAPQAFEAVRSLEQMGREGDIAHAQAALEILENSINRLTPELRNLEKHMR